MTKMTEMTDNIQRTFEMQREFINQNQKMMEQTMEMQMKGMNAFGNASDAGESAHQHVVELNRQMAESYFDALEQSMDEWNASLKDARKAVEQGFDEVEEIQKETWDAFREEVEEATKSYDEMTRNFVEVFESTVESMLDAQQEAEERVVDTAQQVEISAE